MSQPAPEDELLLILLRNLRNVIYTFGESSKQHMSMRVTVQEHLEEMRRKSITTNLHLARLREQQMQMQGVKQTSTQTSSQQPDDLPQLMESLATLKLE
ncbi:hypothetical protein BST61_g6493 [Cercospora zeina]